MSAAPLTVAPVVAGAGAAVVVAVLCLGPRRLPGRVQRLVEGTQQGRPVADPRSPTVGTCGQEAASLAARLGRIPRRLARRPADPVADRRAGWVLLVAASTLLLAPAVSVAVVALALALPVVRRRRARRRRSRLVVDELPDVIDLFRIALDAGLTPRLALDAVVEHGAGIVVDALADVVAQVGHGARLGDAFGTLRDLGPPAHAFVDALVAAERYGAPAVAGLDRASLEARLGRRRSGEEAARRVPVKMLFPLVLCTLPALGLLTVVPLLARTLPSLSP